jgi:hypothetical protein
MSEDMGKLLDEAEFKRGYRVGAQDANASTEAAQMLGGK